MSLHPPEEPKVSAPRAYGVLLAVGLLLGVGIGIALGQPSGGAVIGLAGGALAAIGLRLAGR